MEKNILTFGELEEGKKFVSFPVDGDNAGHGGYKNPHNIFTKIKLPKIKGVDNAVCDHTGTLSSMPDTMEILPVQ